jgi:hypothetical protein
MDPPSTNLSALQRGDLFQVVRNSTVLGQVAVWKVLGTMVRLNWLPDPGTLPTTVQVGDLVQKA